MSASSSKFLYKEFSTTVLYSLKKWSAQKTKREKFHAHRTNSLHHPRSAAIALFSLPTNAVDPRHFPECTSFPQTRNRSPHRFLQTSWCVLRAIHESAQTRHH